MKNPTSMLAGTIILLALTTSQSLAQSAYTPYTFTTLAGNAGYGSVDGTGSVARFYNPSGMATDSAGNVYVADTSNNTIRKVTPAGVVTTLAGLAGSFGSADGTGSTARFGREFISGPTGVAVDGGGNVYLADAGNNTIRKVTPAGVVTTLAGLANVLGATADGTGSAARFWFPTGVAVDTVGNVYVADAGNQTIRRVTPVGTNWVVTTLAGHASSKDQYGHPAGDYADGTGIDARFNGPSGVALDNAGNVYVADTGNNAIRKVTPAGVVTTLAGRAGIRGTADGTGSAALFYNPIGVAVDSAGNIYVADSGNNTIRKVTPVGVVTMVAGLAQFDDNGTSVPGSADGTGGAARFWYPIGVAADSAGNLYVADYWNSTIRKVTPAAVVTTLAGLAGNGGSADGPGSNAQFSGATGVAADSAGNVYVADSRNNTIRKVTPAGVVTTLAGLAGNRGSADGTGGDARFDSPAGAAVDSAGNVYVADYLNFTIRKVTPAGVVTTLAGNASVTNEFGLRVGGYADGTGRDARFYYPFGVAVDSAGNVYVADTFYNTIRKVTVAGVVTTLAGLAQLDANGDPVHGSADGTGSAARFYGPIGVAVDLSGNLYVADGRNNTIRKVTPIGVVTTLAGLAQLDSNGTPVHGSADGTGSVAQFRSPDGVAVDSAGNVYVADTGNTTIRKVTPAGVVTTLAGLAGSAGSVDGTGSDARFGSPYGVAVDSAGNVYVAGNNTIRKGSPVPMGFLLFGPRIGFNGGQFGFFLTGPAGRSVVVEASTALKSWLPVWTNSFAGALNFVDPQSGAYSNRFYRAFMP